MKKKQRLIGTLIVGLLTGFIFLMPITTLTVRLPRDDNRLVDISRVKSGHSIELHYRHSVERTKVVGLFTVDKNGRLLASETRMMSVGTGMPNTASDRTRREGKWLVVDEQHRVFPEIRFYHASVNQTRLKVAGHWVPLGTLPSGSLIRIGTESPCIVQWIAWALAGKAI